MIVNIEFFDEEPIENMITCLNYKVDRVVFFGYCDVMTQEAKELTRRNLKNVCGVRDIVFIELSKTKFLRVVRVMEEAIARELQRGSQCYVDLTGGDDTMLVAMGVVSEKHRLSMHRFDVLTNEIFLLNDYECPGIDKAAERRRIQLSIRDAIALRGGTVIDEHKRMFSDCLRDKRFIEFVDDMWQIASADYVRWNEFSAILKGFVPLEESETVGYLEQEKIDSLLLKNSRIQERSQVLELLRQLAEADVIRDIREAVGKISFTYTKPVFRTCMQDGGCILELYVYYKCKRSGRYQDCRIGLHLDWDGRFVDDPGQNVENEVDVLLMEGNIPVFISCKSGKVNQMALYELQTVARRFGGKYARMELVVAKPLANTYRLRAEEMEIAVTVTAKRKRCG